MQTARLIIRTYLLSAIYIYGAVKQSGWLPFGTCRFFPTCSAYAKEAIGRHGPTKGVRLSVGRIFRCHPGTEGGLDPVP